jgi:CRP/FNR family transcriptional regulator, anaerobic regulatory protein
LKDIVINTLNLIHPLSKELKGYLFDNLKPVSLHKKEIFLNRGEISTKVSFILKGLLRAYYITEEGVDTSVWFMKEGDISISVRSFFERKPSEEFIEAVEDTTLLYITYDELQKAYALYPEFNIVGRIFTERYYVLSEERLVGIRNKKAIERYSFLLKYHPEILLRAPLQYIASYLDIDKATLSRLRHKL